MGKGQTAIPAHSESGPAAGPWAHGCPLHSGLSWQMVCLVLGRELSLPDKGGKGSWECDAQGPVQSPLRLPRGLHWGDLGVASGGSADREVAAAGGRATHPWTGSQAGWKFLAWRSFGGLLSLNWPLLLWARKERNLGAPALQWVVKSKLGLGLSRGQGQHSVKLRLHRGRFSFPPGKPQRCSL